MNVFLERDQQAGINEIKVPRTQNKIFKPFKILRDFPRFPEKEGMNSKVSKIHNEKLAGLGKYQCNRF